MVNDEICGAVVSVRYVEDIISVWNRTAGDQTTTTRIRDTLKRVLNLPPNTILEYKVSQNEAFFLGQINDYRYLTTNTYHALFPPTRVVFSSGSRRFIEIQCYHFIPSL